MSEVVMNPQGTSFIPQRPTQGTVKKRSVRKIYVLTYVSYVLFFGSALAAVGTFFYNTLLDAQLQTQKDNLIAEKDRFSQEDIDSVRDLDKKIETAQKRMDLHLSILPVFDALEKNIASTLQLDSFSYKRENDSAPLIELSGTAKVFNSLMFQRDILSSNPILSGGSFTEVTLLSAPPKDEETGEVLIDEVETKIIFGLAKEVDLSLLQYRPRFSEDANFVETEDVEFVDDLEQDSSVIEGENN